MPNIVPIEVDRVEILSVVDNYSDLLVPGGPNVERPPRGAEGHISTTTLLAEHGLCLIIKVYVNGTSHSILLDSGYTAVAAPHNLEFLGLGLEDIEAIVLSHGHMDHTGALLDLLKIVNKPIKVFAHPDAFAGTRYSITPDEKRIKMPIQASPEQISQAGGELHLDPAPMLIADDTILVSGQVEKTTSFEKGLLNARIEINGEFVQDPVNDDQFLVMRVKDHGLVVVSGCAHSGIVNTVRYAQKLTGQDKLHTVAGGFHLGGPSFEPIIDETVQQLKALGPKVVVPMHCTGFKAQHRFADQFSDEFVLNTVGSKIVVGQAITA